MKLKKIVCSTLAIAILIASSVSAYATSTEPSTTKALSQGSVLELPKEDITFIKGDYDHLGDLEYTYTAGGKQYKVIETSDEALSRVDSEIYALNDDGDYTKFAEQTIRKSDSAIICTIVENGKKNVQKIPLPNKSAPIIRENSASSTTVTPDGLLPTTDWIFYGSFNSSTKIAQYTVTAVAAIISGIVSASTLGVGTTIVITATTALVAEIVKDHIPTVYYTDYVYYKTVIPPDPGQFRMKVAEKNSRYFYSDSARTNAIQGSPVYTTSYVSGYEE